MRALALMMVVMLVFSSTIWAATPEFLGRLHSSGVVLTNAVQIPDGGTVRSGDSISTQPGGLAVITSSSHGRLEVRPDSQARLAADRVQLERGSVAASRLPIEIGGYTVRPETTGSSWFAVANRDGHLVVAAYRGNVIIASAGAPPVVVNEGSLAQQAGEQEQTQGTPQTDRDQPQQEPGNKKKKAAGGWTIGSLSHAGSVALLVGLGAAGAAASAGAAVALTGQNPSPSR